MTCTIAVVIALLTSAASYSLSRAEASVKQDPVPSGTRSVVDGVYASAQAQHGQEIYKMQCSSCHEDTLLGGESAPALAGGEFIANWNGLTVGDLFERIRTSMPLNNPGSLGREADADVVAYILSVNKFPAGQPMLPHDTQLLKQIRIEPINAEGSKKDR